MGHDQKICKKVFSLFLGSSCRETPKNAINKIRGGKKKEKKGRAGLFCGPTTHTHAAKAKHGAARKKKDQPTQDT